MSNSVLHGDAFLHALKSRFQTTKCSHMSSDFLQWGRYSAAQESSFQLRNVKTWVVPTCKVVNFLILRYFQLWNCRQERTSIC